jgi:beta-glucanase (GH16 family)
VRFQTQEGQWSAFWLQSQTYGQVPGDTNVSGAEIDIFEYRAIYPRKIQHALYWEGEDGSLDGAAQNLEILDEASGWHTIGLDWSQDEYIFYVDGVETWRTSDAVSGAPQYIILSMEVASWGGDISDATLPDSVEFDYIRVYSEKP